MLLSEREWNELIERSRFVAVDPNLENEPPESDEQFHAIVNPEAEENYDPELNDTNARLNKQPSLVSLTDLKALRNSQNSDNAELNFRLNMSKLRVHQEETKDRGRVMQSPNMYESFTTYHIRSPAGIIPNVNAMRRTRYLDISRQQSQYQPQQVCTSEQVSYSYRPPFQEYR